MCTRAVDLHSFFADPDPAVLLSADPDPAAFKCGSGFSLTKFVKNFLVFFQFFPANFPSWIRICILNTDPGGKMIALERKRRADLVYGGWIFQFNPNSSHNFLLICRSLENCKLPGNALNF